MSEKVAVNKKNNNIKYLRGILMVLPVKACFSYSLCPPKINFYDFLMVIPNPYQTASLFY